MSPVLRILVLLLVTAHAAIAEAGGFWDRQIELVLIQPHDGDPPDTHDVKVKAFWIIADDVETYLDLSTDFTLFINDSVPTTVTKQVVFDIGPVGPSLCGTATCGSTCGEVIVGGTSRPMVCTDDGCGCRTASFTVTVGSGLTLVEGDQIRIELNAAHGAMPDADTSNDRGALAIGGLRTRLDIADVQRLPINPVSIFHHADLVINPDLIVEFKGESTLPIDLTATMIPSLSCDLNPADCASCCLEACDCPPQPPPKAWLVSNFSVDTGNLPGYCSTNPLAVCGSAVVGGAFTLLRCDAETDSCILRLPQGPIRVPLPAEFGSEFRVGLRPGPDSSSNGLILPEDDVLAILIDDKDDDGLLDVLDACPGTAGASAPDGSLIGDLNGDCRVDLLDYSILQTNVVGP